MQRSSARGVTTGESVPRTAFSHSARMRMRKGRSARCASHLGVGHGGLAGMFLPVDAAADLFLTGATVPTGWLVTPHAGGSLTAVDVARVIQQGIMAANVTRAQIRLPSTETTRMVFAVTDS